MKTYGGCKYFHTLIYGLLSMMEEEGFSWQDIEEVHYVVSGGCRCTIEPAELKWNPKTAAEALFSNPYAVAYAAIEGDCFLDCTHSINLTQVMMMRAQGNFALGLLRNNNKKKGKKEETAV